MPKTAYILVFTLFLLLFLNSCADPRPLTGGPTDTKPPKIDSTRYSSPNFQTNFRDKEIILTFDEWVQLKDAYNQVIISPPMTERPDIKLKHKSVLLRFKEPLLENTTYSIQFGGAIADFTEGNVADNLRFVFSTGDVIDSLRVSGQLTDAVTGAPMPKVWVMLYDNLADSVPLTERPLYLSKTDEQGFFSLENLRQDSFRIFALNDLNANYKYDQPSESIAFWQESFFLTDSTQGVFKLRMFSEGDKLTKSSAKLQGKGQLKIKFNQTLKDSIAVRPLNPMGNNFLSRLEFAKDTLLYWWSGREEAFKLLIEVPARSWVDTIDVNPATDTILPPWGFVNASSSVGTAARGKAKSKQEEQVVNKINPNVPLRIALSRPLQSIDTTKIAWLDSAKTPILMLDMELELKETAARFLTLQSKIPATPILTLRMLPGALTDIWGESNPDTLLRVYGVLGVEDLGNLTAKIINADSTMQYIIQFLDEGENLLDEVIMFEKKELELKYKLLEPQKYTLKVIHDADANGVFTNGSYQYKRQPELITDSKPISLRKGWDNEMEVNLGALLPSSEKKKGKGK